MSKKAIVLCGLLCAAGLAHSADEIHFTIRGQNAVTFDWRGKENTISYGTASGVYTNTVIAATPVPLPTSSRGPFWEADITGLQENTLYYYVIGSSSKEHTFRTPLPRGSSDFIVYGEGDIGSTTRGKRVGNVQNLIVEDFRNPNLPRIVLGLGDLSYGEKDLLSVDRHFNDMMAWSLDIPYMPIWGNHDWDEDEHKLDQVNNYEGRFAFPNSRSAIGAYIAVGNGPGEDWYWFDYGNARFIAYPDPYTGADGITWPAWKTAVLPIMEAAQADPAIKFIVTFGHRPAYASGSHPGEKQLKDILDALGDGYSKYVLDLSGHNHDYERIKAQHGVVHITAGTGGAGLGTADTPCLWRICPQPPVTAFRAMRHGILRLKFSAAGIEGGFICGLSKSGQNDIICTRGEIIDPFLISPR